VEKEEIVSAIRRIVRGDLADCDRALRNRNVDRARRELSDATTKFDRLMKAISQPAQASDGGGTAL